MGVTHDSSSTSGPTVDPSTVGLFLAEQRRIIAQRVLAGASGAETMAAMTELVDGLIVGRYRNAVREGAMRLPQPVSTNVVSWPWAGTDAANWPPIRTSI